MKVFYFLFLSFIISSFANITHAVNPVDPIELHFFFEDQANYYQEKGFKQANQPCKTSFLVTEHGLETVTWDMELMRHAKHSIELSGSFCGNQLFRNMLKIMEEKLLTIPHFQVYILTAQTLMEQEEEKIVKEMTSRFPGRFHFQYTANVLVLLPDLTTIDNHVKMLVVDEKYFTTGGTNRDDVLATEGTYPPPRNVKGGIVGAWLPAGVRDMDIVGFGALAKELRLEFYKLYSLWTAYNKKGSLPKKEENCPEYNVYFPILSDDLAVVETLDYNDRLIDDAEIEMIISGPMHTPNKITQKYADLMDSATSEVIVANLYWNPAEVILQAAKRTVNRGIDFRLYTNGINDLSPKYNDLSVWASRINYVPIFYGRDFHIWEVFNAKKSPVRNTRVFEYHVKDILYHKKVMVIDRDLTIMGSYNLGTKSDKSDYEMVLLIRSKKAADDFLKVIAKDEQLSLEISHEKARDWYFNPIIVYLAGTQKSFHGFMSAPYDQKAEEHANDLAKKMKEWNNSNSVLY